LLLPNFDLILLQWFTILAPPSVITRVVPPLHALVGFTSCHKYGLSSFLLWYTWPQKCPLLLREQLA